MSETTPPAPTDERATRKERTGLVVSDAADKTIVVSIERTKTHPLYRKTLRRSKTYHAHDERNEAGLGDIVRIVETRPISKTKHWRLEEIVRRAD